MGSVFISHSNKDKNGKAFLQSLFGSVSHNGYFYGWEGPREPHTDVLKERIEKSDSLFVLSSPYLERLATASWVSFEVGVAVASSKPVWVLEYLIGFGRYTAAAVPIPGVTGYIERPGTLKNLRTEPYYSLVAGAGKEVPVGPNGRPLRKVECLNEKCQASYYVYFTGHTLVCPVCRKRNTFG